MRTVQGPQLRSVRLHGMRTVLTDGKEQFPSCILPGESDKAKLHTAIHTQIAYHRARHSCDWITSIALVHHPFFGILLSTSIVLYNHRSHLSAVSRAGDE